MQMRVGPLKRYLAGVVDAAHAIVVPHEESS